jgi:hypothetical protein
VASSCAPDGAGQSEAPLALKRDKSTNPAGCPNPRDDWVGIDSTTGEMFPLPCSRNSCPHCRRRNVQVTAAKMGINQTLTDRPITHAVLSTTRDWLPDDELRAGWQEAARLVKRNVNARPRYAWFREWTEGRNDGIRRTHYHSTWALDNDDQAQAVTEISRRVWAARAGAYSEKAHGWKPVFDAGGLTRYIAGLVGHHLKSNQAPPPGWSGRRFGTSRGFYAIDSRELDKQAKSAVRDERLMHHLELELLSSDGTPDGLPEMIVDELVTQRFEALRDRPPPMIVRLDRHSMGRDEDRARARAARAPFARLLGAS